MKTIRVQANGIIREAMAFENIDYQEVYENDNWYDSRLYEIFSSRFMFVFFKEQTQGKGDYILENVFFFSARAIITSAAFCVRTLLRAAYQST